MTVLLEVNHWRGRVRTTPCRRRAVSERSELSRKHRTARRAFQGFETIAQNSLQLCEEASEELRSRSAGATDFQMKVQWPDGSFGILYSQRFAPRAVSIVSFSGHYDQFSFTDPSDSPQGLTWVVTLKDGNLYEYFYPPQTLTAALPPLVNITRTSAGGFVPGDLQGGEYFNFCTRATLLLKRLL